MAPEQIAEAGQRLARLEQERRERADFEREDAKRWRLKGDEDSALLCDRCCADATKAADDYALAQTALREWVQREDRAKALFQASAAASLGSQCVELAKYHSEFDDFEGPEAHDDYVADVAAASAQYAHRARRLLKLEDTP